jgi:hypothetical protein
MWGQPPLGCPAARPYRAAMQRLSLLLWSGLSAVESAPSEAEGTPFPSATAEAPRG